MARKKLAVVIAALGAMQAGFAGAVGLGEFTLGSALNQPLNAEIRLSNTEDLDASQIRIGLASAEDFSKAGVSRDFFLTNLRFAIELDGQGNGVVKVSSREQVVEPYLNFVLEARWPTGRLLREYTVLLDLPVFGDAPQAPITTASSAAVMAPTAPVQPEMAQSVPTVRPALDSTRKTLSEGSLQPGDKYRVKRDDTLWKIAARVRPADDLSVQQTMVSIQRNNPNAFIKGNINRLKAGYILRLPDEEQVRAISRGQAVSEVAGQNQKWRSGSSDMSDQAASAPQLDATPSEPAVTDRFVEQPRLSIAAAGDNQGAAMGDGQGADQASSSTALANLQDEIAVREENLAKANRENAELNARLDDMEAKIATLQRLLELKDDQLAAIQANAANEQGSEKAAVPVAASKVASSVAGASDNTGLYAGIGGGLLALLAGLLWWSRRRKSSESAPAAAVPAFEPESVDDIGSAIEETVSEPEAEFDAQDDSVDALAAELEQEIAAQAAAEQAAAAVVERTPIKSETGDAIAEADIYIAYGRYQQASDLLKTALEQEPARADLHVKLLEVYIDTRDKASFQQQYLQLKSLADSSAEAAVKEKLSTVDGVSAWLNDLPSEEAGVIDQFDEVAAVDEPEQGVELSDAASDELDMTLDFASDVEEDFDLDLDLDLNEAGESLSADETQQFSVADLDAELQGLADAPAAQPEGELELSLDLDEDLADDDIDARIDQLADEAELELASLEGDSAADDELEIDLDLDFEQGAAQDAGGELSLAEQELSLLDESEAAEDELSLDLGADSEFDQELEGLSLDGELDDLDSELEQLASSQTPAESTERDLALEDDLSFELDDAPLELDETATSTDSTATEAELEEDFDFLGDADEVATKLDLARAYIDMGDAEGARDILEEVKKEGSEQQVREASELLERID